MDSMPPRWAILLTDRRRLGAPCRLVGPKGRPTFDRDKAIVFPSELHALAYWNEMAVYVALAKHFVPTAVEVSWLGGDVEK